jgi:cellulose synthase/poly-beta-1,6-N-acetylglucosamine synthase-like glycosyltransferase
MRFQEIASGVFLMFNLMVFVYFVLLNSTYLVLFGAALIETRKYLGRSRAVDLEEVFRSPLTPSISVLIPAYNEESVIIEVTRAALGLRYPHFEVVVINDGSTDSTLERLKREFGLQRITRLNDCKVPCAIVNGVYISSAYENLVVVDKVNGGKADALNAGINVSVHDIICVVDADSLVESDALLKIARPFMERPDDTVATGGVIRIANGCEIAGSRVTKVKLPRNYWANVQIVEYLRAFLGARVGWSAFRAMLIISGALGGFDRRTVIDIGGYNRETVGEDMELVVRMHRYLRSVKRPYRMYFLPDPVCWTQVPESWKGVARQRDRWQRGLIESLNYNGKMLLNPRYGVIGMLAMPYYVFFELMGPMFELVGYIMVITGVALNLVDFRFLYLFLAVAVLYGVIVSLIAIFIEGVAYGHYPRLPALLKLCVYAVLDNVGYRQVNTWWRTKAYVTYYTRRRKWGESKRLIYSDAGGAKP